MSHLDEGQLHALIDGELNQTERRAVEAHLEACAECRREFAEAKALMAGADDLIASVQLPSGAGAGAVVPMARPGAFRWRNVAWAASIVTAVGLGWLSRADYRNSPRDVELSQGAGETAPAPALADSFQAEEKGHREPTLEFRRDEAAKPKSTVDAPAAAPASPSPQTASPEVVKQNEPIASIDAVRALTNPADKDAEDRRRDVGAVVADQARPAQKAETAEQPSAAPVPAPASPQPLAAGRSLPKESAAAGNFAAPSAAVTAQRRKLSLAGFRPAPMEEAVRILGGAIRLVDGMTPTAVLVGPGTLVSGADPGLEIVRVVYDDPPGRELWLDQQRPREALNELDAGGKGATTLLPGDTLVTSGPAGQRGLRWIHQSGFRLGLTGFLPADSLRALARRIQ